MHLAVIACLAAILASKGKASAHNHKMIARWHITSPFMHHAPLAAALRSPFLRQLRGGADLQESPEESVPRGDVGVGEGNVTKSSAKNLRKIAEREAKKHMDPKGLAKLEQGVEAFTKGDYTGASSCFIEAAKICSTSTAAPAQANRTAAVPSAAKRTSLEKAETAQTSPGMRLILAAPETNLQVLFDCI
jgi:hypothetical protein